MSDPGFQNTNNGAPLNDGRMRLFFHPSDQNRLLNLIASEKYNVKFGMTKKGVKQAAVYFFDDKVSLKEGFEPWICFENRQTGNIDAVIGAEIFAYPDYIPIEIGKGIKTPYIGSPLRRRSEKTANDQNQTVCGFQTAAGSIYAMNPTTGKTVRYKHATGEVFDAMMCLFIEPRDKSIIALSNALDPSMFPIKFGITPINDESMAKCLTDRVSIPDECKPRIFMTTHDGSRVIRAVDAQASPKPGLLPIELGVENKMHTPRLHMGNEVVKIFFSLNDLYAAAQKSGAPEPFFEKIESLKSTRHDKARKPKPSQYTIH